MIRAKTVNEYISSAPKEHQEKLKQLRSIILEIAPEAEEKISYGMPYYGYKGRFAYFAFAKKHVGLYLTPPIMELFKEDLKKYATATATIRFPWNEDLPVTLIKKLLKARRKLNEERK